MSEEKRGWRASLWTALAILVAVGAVGAAWIVVTRSNDHDLTGHISVAGECPSTDGVRVLVTDPDGNDLGSGPVTEAAAIDGCDLDFAFAVARSDAYVFWVEPATGEPIEGPTLSPNDLDTGAWDVAFSPLDFPGLEALAVE